jgi:hypothetical protein
MNIQANKQARITTNAMNQSSSPGTGFKIKDNGFCKKSLKLTTSHQWN